MAKVRGGTRALLIRLGASLRPVDDRARSWQVLQRGLSALEARKKPTAAQARELAEKRRSLKHRGEWNRPGHKRLSALLKRFNTGEVKASKKPPRVADLASQAQESLARDPDRRVFWIPDDPSKLHKKFDLFSDFRKFVRRPQYKKALEAESKAGRFVIGKIDPDTGDIMRRKDGKPRVVATLGKKKARKK